jgi:hypothetical protein
MAKAEDTMMNGRVQKGGVGALSLPFSSSVDDSIVDELSVFVLIGFGRVMVDAFVPLVVLPFMVEPVIGGDGGGFVSVIGGDGCVSVSVIGVGVGGDGVVDGSTSTGLALLVKTLYMSLG